MTTKSRKPICSVVFCMGVEYFQVWMERLAIHYARGWEFAKGRKLILSEYQHTPSRVSWRVSLNEGEGCAGVEAYEQMDGNTNVEFYDGYDPEVPERDYPPIGAGFKAFCEVLIWEGPTSDKQAGARMVPGE